MSLSCSKCNKHLSSKYNLKRHQEICNGLTSTQCDLCHKHMSSLQAKYRHKKNNVCERNGTVIITNTQSHNNNSFNDNSINITNSQIHIHLPKNFGNENIDMNGTVKKLFNDNNNEFLMYILGEIIRETYFNKDKPYQQTIKKDIKHDKMMEFFKDEEWKFAPPKVIIKEFLRKLDTLVDKYIPEKLDEFNDAEMDENKRIRHMAIKDRLKFLENIQPYITMIEILLNFKSYSKYTKTFDKENYEWPEEKYISHLEEIIVKLTQQL